MTTDQELAARYGVASGRRTRQVVGGIVVVAYLAVAAWVGISLSRGGVEGNVLGWSAQERSVQVELEVRGTAPGAVDCVVKATDPYSVDVGYSTVTLPGSPATYEVSIPTVVRAGSVAVLGCAAAGEDLRVPPPDFPPGVAIPES